MRLISAMGTGLLIGTALLVIIPEGIETLYTSSSVSLQHTIHISPPADMPIKGAGAALALHQMPKPDSNAGVHRIQYDTPEVKGTDRFLPGEEEPTPPKGSEPKSSRARRAEEDHHHGESTPHAWIGISLISGFILMYLIDIVPTISPASGLSSNEHTHHIPLSTIDPEATPPTHHIETQSSRSRPNPTTVGLLIHALADGIALGASSTSSASSAKSSLGIVIFIAILVHKAPAAFGLTAILLKEGVSKRSARGHLLLFSLAAPTGAVVTWMIINILGQAGKGESGTMKWWTGLALMFSGGTFLYVALHAMQTISSSSHSHGSHAHEHIKVASSDGTEEWESPYAETNGRVSIDVSQMQEKTRGEVALVVLGMLLPLLTQIGHAHAHG
jgi:zinc transporter 9